MLYEYLQANYDTNQPIFYSDINLSVTETNLRQMFKNLYDLGKIKRFDKCVYYLPKKSRLKGGTTMATEDVVKAKYIVHNEQVNGYYSGNTFANLLGISTQVPYVVEIVTNNTSAKFKEINLNGKKFILRKSKVAVTNDNYRVLQFLELLTNASQYIEDNHASATAIIKKYMCQEGIDRNDVDKYINYFPERAYKTIYEMRIFNVLI